MKEPSAYEDYYLKYGLDRDPFPEDKTDNIFFITPELNHRIELIKHLLENSHQVLVVTGPRESGKSTLARYLASVFDENRAVSRVAAGGNMDREILAGVILEDTQHLDVSGAGSSVSRLHRYLEFCGMEQRLPVILIDDGQELTIDTLNFILQLNALVHNNTRFRFVLFGGEEINRSLEDPGIKMSETGIVHNISLPLIRLEQIPAYLRHRLDSSGKTTLYPFSDRDAGHIYRVSGGAPGKINRVARQTMLDPADFITVEERSYSILIAGFLRGLRNPIVIGIIICLGIAVYYVIADSPADRQAQSMEIGLPVERPSGGTEESRPAANRGTITREQEEAFTTRQKVSLPGGSEAGEPITAGGGVIRETTNGPAEAVPRSAMLSGMRGSDWIRDQDPEKYVLQMIGARDIRTLEKYLATVPEMRNQLAILATSNAGEPWYIFIYGLYPDRDAAVADLAGLPAEARVGSPWPRTLAGIQLDLD